jgi:hypothetical protein
MRRLSWPSPQAPYQSRRLPGYFQWNPRCSFSRTSAFRLSPRRFEPRMEMRIVRLWKRHNKRRQNYGKEANFGDPHRSQ